MQAYNNAYSLLTPVELRQRALIGSFAINTILLVSLISTMGYWYVLGLEASTATGIWAVIAFSIIGLGLITEFVKKITLSLFRHKAIWLSATVISVLTIAGTLSIIDSNKETGLIRSSSGYQLAQSRQENALNNATQYAWASAFNLNQLQNDLVALTAKRERRAIRYQAYLAEKQAINEKIAAKRNYDSELAMQTMAGKIMANGSSLQTSSNPLLYGVASATGAGVSFLKLAFYLAVTLLLEFSAWFLGGEVEKIKNQLRFDSKQLLELQNIETFGMAFSEVLRPALDAPETVPAEKKHHNLLPRNKPKTDLKVEKQAVNEKPVDVDKSTLTESVYTNPVNTVSVNTNLKRIERIDRLYIKSQESKSGEKVMCPVCEISFEKTGFKIFCSNKGKGNCSDEYHNIKKPERLKALANKRRKQGSKKEEEVT